MADATGILSAMGIKDLASWGASWSTVDEKIPVLTEGLVQSWTRIADESLTGSAGRTASDQGVQAVSGPTNHILDYNNYDTLFEMIFGAKSTRTFTLSDDNLNKWVGIELEKTVSRWRFWAAKATKLVLSGEADQHVKADFDWIFRDVARSAAAFPLTDSDLPGARTKVRFEDLDFWIADHADAIAAGDRIRISSFELEIDRVLVADDYASKSGTVTDEKKPLEPIPNGFRVVNFKIGIPRYDADTFQDWKDDDEPLQAKMTFTRGGETMVIDLPDLRIVDGADASIDGPERIQDEVNFEVAKPESTNPLYTGGEVRAIFT
jgi:hypothetical protein